MPEPERVRVFTCWICKKPVRLEEVVTDVFGYPMHKECEAEMQREDKVKHKVGEATS